VAVACPFICHSVAICYCLPFRSIHPTKSAPQGALSSNNKIKSPESPA
jgi:hypothetical protein